MSYFIVLIYFNKASQLHIQYNCFSIFFSYKCHGITVFEFEFVEGKGNCTISIMNTNPVVWKDLTMLKQH